MVAVVVVTLIGNLRVQASEAVQRGPAASPAAVVDAPEDWRITTIGEPAGSGAADGVEVVPAIYAWNPDVRFVYFRHVSKWM